MKKLFLCVFLLGFITLGWADLTEEKSVSVSFPGFGDYQSETVSKYQKWIKYEESQSSLKGEGFWGSMFAKFFPNGKNASITKLEEATVYNLNWQDSTFTKVPIQSMFEDQEEGEWEEGDVDVDEDGEQEEGNMRIIRQEFKVIDTGETKQLNQFKTHHYQILYLCEKEELDTKKRHTDSLFVDIFAAPNVSEFEQAIREKSDFQQKYYELIGLEMDEQDAEAMLGLNWLNMLQAMDENQAETDMDIDFSQLQKIEGHPVLTDGSFYTKIYDPSLEQTQPEKKKKRGGFGGFGALGNLAGALEEKAMDAVSKKQDDNGVYKKALSYRMETKSLQFDSLSSKQFEVPSGFTEKTYEGNPEGAPFQFPSFGE